jgi:hypothetical protein
MQQMFALDDCVLVFTVQCNVLFYVAYGFMCNHIDSYRIK